MSPTEEELEQQRQAGWIARTQGLPSGNNPHYDFGQIGSPDSVRLSSLSGAWYRGWDAADRFMSGPNWPPEWMEG